MMIRFQYSLDRAKYNDVTALESIDFTIGDHASLDDVLGAFEAFLGACGYVLNGKLDVVPEDEY
jgi:hypothetical protein